MRAPATLLLTVCLFAAARPAPAADGDRTCAVPVNARPPDPRCDETLDGRDPPDSANAPSVPKLVLTPPRLASRILLWPIVEAGAFVESRHLLDWMEAILTTDDGRIGIRPELRYASGFLLSGGARFFYHPKRLPDAGLLARVHSSGPAVLLGELSWQMPAWLGLSGRAVWDRREDRLFAGIGAATLPALQERGRGLSRYGSDAALLQVSWARPGAVSLYLHGDLQRRDYRSTSGRGGRSIAELYGLGADGCADRGLPPGCVDPVLVPGFQEGLRIAHLGGGVALDLENDARDGGGLRLRLDSSYGLGLGRDPSRHLLLGAESQLGLGGSDRALLLRLRASTIERLGRAPIPFEELVAPTGPSEMRAFPDGRLRGPSAIVGAVEYRWFIAFNLDAAIFVDLGTVAGARFAGVGRSHLFPGAGLGIRRFRSATLYWRAPVEDGFQIAYSRESGVRLLLSTAAF
jgi:hypothetical protein